MKNNKGQVLVLFLLLLPIITLALAFIIDSSLMFYNKNYLDSINKDILTSLNKKIDVSNEDIKLLYSLNDEDIVIDEVKIENRSIYIKTHKYIKPIFGKIIGMDKYTVTSEKEVKYTSNILMYFEINNNEVNSLDGRGYNIINGVINIKNFDLKNYSLEIGFTNLEDTQFMIGNSRFFISNNSLYLNDTLIGPVNERNIIDLVGTDKARLYLNGDFIKEVDNLSGDLIINTKNIKYVKSYDMLLTDNNIMNNYDKNRSWLDEE